MRLHRLFLIFPLLAIWSSPLLAQCPAGEYEVRLELDPDAAWYEVHWYIRDIATDSFYIVGDAQEENYQEYRYCLPNNGCKYFTITDDYGDGLSGFGSAKFYVNDVLALQEYDLSYRYADSVMFGCLPGSLCVSPIDIDTGTWVTPNANETWYRFVPADTGIYKISSCSLLNTCGSKIWMYSTCSGLYLSENQVGADVFAEGECDNGAETSLFLAAGEDYFIRLRYATPGCSASPIHFTLTYEGPIKGCLDPTACNYQPLATVSDTCYYNGSPLCPELPDLSTNEAAFRSSMALESKDVANPCLVEEGCMRGLGTRFILAFDTYITNIGNQDYYIGETPEDINTPSSQFIWDPCHHHWHYLGYAEYILFNSAGVRLPIGSKAGFCVLDLICPPPTEKKFNCTRMGLTAGCSDVYDKTLDCQWVDITGIPPDDYTLVMRVNWDQSRDSLGRAEKEFENNWAQACFSLSYNGSNPDVEFHNDVCAPYVDCLGVKYGDALPDCNGVCNGPSLHGDWNQDTLRTVDDTQAYLAAANADSGDASSCLDLDADGTINVYDAALLQECSIHQDEPQYWIQEFACQFPTGFENTADLVALRAGAVDTIAKTFDIEIINPFNKVLGYEFSVSGLVIESVENIQPGYNGDLRFNPATSEIIGLGLDESAIEKNPLPDTLLRIHYSELTGTEVCVEKITAIVNNLYQRSNASIVTPACVMVKTSSVATPDNNAFRVYVQPNPFDEKTTVYFENEQAEPVNFTLTDVTGKTLRTFEGVTSNSVSIERGNLPAGAYFFTLRSSKGRVSGKIIAR